MHAHGIEVFNRANDDAVIRFVADHFHFVLFPADQTLIDQNLTDGRRIKSRLYNQFEFFPVVGNAAARAAHCEGRADDGGKTDFVRLERNHGLDEAGRPVIANDLALFVADGRRRRDHGAGILEPYAVHGFAEQFAVFSHFDGFGFCTNQFDAEFGKHTHVGERQRRIECGLPTHRRQKGVGPFLGDDLGDDFGRDWLDVGCVGHVRIGHDGRGVRVDQDNAIALGFKSLAGLRSRIIELTGLPDNDRASANDEDGFDICAFGHGKGDFYCSAVALAIAARRLKAKGLGAFVPRPLTSCRVSEI